MTMLFAVVQKRKKKKNTLNSKPKFRYVLELLHVNVKNINPILLRSDFDEVFWLVGQK